MDCPFPVVPDDGDMPWSDSHSMDSDDIHSMGIPPSPWLDSLSGVSTSLPTSSAVSFIHTGQLSPASTRNDMDMASTGGDSSASISSPSASPPFEATVLPGPSMTCPDPWTLAFPGSSHLSDIDGSNNDHGDHDHHDHDDHHDHIAWEHDPDDVLMAPKIEPVEDDDFCMDDLKEAPSTPVPAVESIQPKPKRPRGRPRKHPLATRVVTNKITKGRSKTGCLTCRKRKKKCDEAKPRCESLIASWLSSRHTPLTSEQA